MNWQPIETAPKDGTVILGYEEPDVIPIYWYRRFWHLHNVTWGDESSEVFGPTHWMPIHAAPNDGEPV